MAADEAARLVYVEIYWTMRESGLLDVAKSLQISKNLTEEEISGPRPTVRLGEFAQQYFGGGPSTESPVKQVENEAWHFIPLANLHPKAE